MLFLRVVFFLPLFWKVVPRQVVVPSQVVQSFFSVRCDMEMFSWIRDVRFALQCCSEKILLRTRPYHLHWPSSFCFSESSNCSQLVSLSFRSPPWEPILVSVNWAEAERVKPIVPWTPKTKDVWVLQVWLGRWETSLPSPSTGTS